MLLSKPIIAPSILFFYLQENRLKINWRFVIVLILFFVGDMMVLLEFEEKSHIIPLLFLIGYCFFLKDILDDLLQLRIKFVNKKNLLVLLICLFFLIYLLVTILDLMIDSQQQNLMLFVLYGIVLVLIGIVSSFCYVIKQIRFTFFMLLTSLCFVISDVFYILKSHFEEVEIFGLLNNLPQALSYYFLAKYYLLRPLQYRK